VGDGAGIDGVTLRLVRKDLHAILLRYKSEVHEGYQRAKWKM
jgi:hypothetical protein